MQRHDRALDVDVVNLDRGIEPRADRQGRPQRAVQRPTVEQPSSELQCVLLVHPAGVSPGEQRCQRREFLVQCERSSDGQTATRPAREAAGDLRPVLHVVELNAPTLEAAVEGGVPDGAGSVDELVTGKRAAPSWAETKDAPLDLGRKRSAEPGAMPSRRGCNSACPTTRR